MLSWAYTEAIIPYTDVGNGNDGNVEGEDDKTILSGESETMLQFLKDKSKLSEQESVYWW